MVPTDDVPVMRFHLVLPTRYPLGYKNVAHLFVWWVFGVSGVNPVDARVPVEPAALPADVSSGTNNGSFQHIVPGQLAGTGGEDLGVADGSAGGRVGYEAAIGDKVGHFINESLGKHLFGSLGDAGVQPVAGGAQPNDDGVPSGRGGFRGLGGGERPAGEFDDFECPDGAARIVGFDNGGGLRIEDFQMVVEGCDADVGKFFLPVLSHLWVGGGKLPVVDEGLHVEHGAADEDGEFPAGHDVCDGGDGEVLVVGDGGGFGDVPDVEQMVGNAGTFGDGEFGGADVHASVELHGVNVDNFAVAGVGEADAEGRFSGGGGPNNGNRPDGRYGHCSCWRCHEILVQVMCGFTAGVVWFK